MAGFIADSCIDHTNIALLTGAYILPLNRELIRSDQSSSFICHY